MARHENQITFAKACIKAEDWRGAAIAFYEAYCEHPSKWQIEPNTEREILLALSNENWEKHLASFEIGQLVRLPSGMGGSFDGICTAINEGQIYIEIDNQQYSDWHGKTHSASYKEARRLKT